jgi:hypothetical protein
MNKTIDKGAKALVDMRNKVANMRHEICGIIAERSRDIETALDEFKATGGSNAELSAYANRMQTYLNGLANQIMGEMK